MGISLVINNRQNELQELTDSLCETFKSDFILKEDWQSTKELLRLLPNVQLVIFRMDQSLTEIWNYLQQEKRPIPLVVLGEGVLPSGCDPKQVFQITEYTNTELILEQVAKILGISYKKIKEKRENYFPLAVNFICEKKNFPYNLYLQLRKESGEVEFQLIHQSHDPFDSQKMTNYAQQGYTHFFITQDDYNRLLVTESALALKKQSPAEDFLYQENDLANLSTEEVNIPSGLKKLGVSQNSFQQCNQAIQHLFNRVRNTHHLQNYLQRFFKGPQTYVYKQNHLLAYLGTQILHNLREGELEERIEQWVFAAFFHDLPLVNDEQVKIRSDSDMQVASLNPRERDVVKNHAQMAVAAIDECGNVPPGTRSIILHHHGSTIGVGFPKYPNQSIAPMAILFIVIEEFVINYLENKRPIQEIIKELYERFPGEKFHNMIDVLSMISHEHMTHE